MRVPIRYGLILAALPLMDTRVREVHNYGQLGVRLVDLVLVDAVPIEHDIAVHEPGILIVIVEVILVLRGLLVLSLLLTVRFGGFLCRLCRLKPVTVGRLLRLNGRILRGLLQNLWVFLAALVVIMGTDIVTFLRVLIRCLTIYRRRTIPRRSTGGSCRSTRHRARDTGLHRLVLVTVRFLLWLFLGLFLASTARTGRWTANTVTHEYEHWIGFRNGLIWSVHC